MIGAGGPGRGDLVVVADRVDLVEMGVLRTCGGRPFGDPAVARGSAGRTAYRGVDEGAAAR